MTHFEQLEELVNDEDKIVTVPNFALLRKISTEEAQNTVNKLLDVHEKLHKTYILSGIKKSTGVHSVVIVNEQTLSNEKEAFNDDPQQTVFSIQKGASIDYNVVFQASLDTSTLNDSIPGSIVGKNCTKRRLIKTVISASSNNAPKATKTSLFSKNTSAEVTKPACLPEGSKEESKKSDTKQSNSIANMFNKAAQNKKVESKAVSTSQKPKQGGSLQNFFTRQPSKESQPIKKEVTENLNESVTNGSDSDEQIMNDFKMQVDDEVKTEKSPKVKKEDSPKKKQKNTPNKKSDLFDSDTDEEIMKDLKIQQVETKKAAKSTGKKSKQNKASQKKKQTPSEKKRKRIVVADDSDSDIFQSDEDDHDILEDLKQPDPEPVEDVKPPPPGKSRRRKAVKRTYEDDEGFIVTQTEYVYETASEDENEPNNKVSKKEVSKPKLEKKDSSETTDASPNKNVTNKKGAKKPAANQPTLMSFFKKK